MRNVAVTNTVKIQFKSAMAKMVFLACLNSENMVAFSEDSEDPTIIYYEFDKLTPGAANVLIKRKEEYTILSPLHNPWGDNIGRTMFVSDKIAVRMKEAGYMPRQSFALLHKLPCASPADQFHYKFVFNIVPEFRVHYNINNSVEVIAVPTYQQASDWLWKMGARFEYTPISGGGFDDQLNKCIDIIIKNPRKQ